MEIFETLSQFKEQIDEDIALIKEEFSIYNSRLESDDYSFNYWILSRIYSIDETEASITITEYRDHGIDCYVNFEESKELFLIQNKYYSENTLLSKEDVTKFLDGFRILKEEKYIRSPELQKIFNRAKRDNEYKIHLHLFVTNNSVNSECESLIKEFKMNNNGDNVKATITAKIYLLKDIYRIHFGQSFRQSQRFEGSLNIKVKGSRLQILPEEYGLKDMSKALYLMTSITDIFTMYDSSRSQKYELFEENIREYLGKETSINGGIIKTLRDKKDRHNFFYYNNGITIICEKYEENSNTGGQGFRFSLTNPQIVNGCQTVNTIYEELNNFDVKTRLAEYGNVYIMVKVLIFNEEVKLKKGDDFYKNIVKYTNKQNSINETAFGANQDIFATLQKEFIKRGFLLQVKPSDKYQFKKLYDSPHSLGELLEKSSRYFTFTDSLPEKLADVTIPLEKMLQVFLSLVIDGYAPYKKKSLLLKPSSEIYIKYSVKVQDYLSTDNMIRLYLMHKQAEAERKDNPFTQTPIPHYLTSILGVIIREKHKRTDNNLEYNSYLSKLFSNNSNIYKGVFAKLSIMTSQYKKKYFSKNNTEYNTMIKSKIDEEILKEIIDDVIEYTDDQNVKLYLSGKFQK